MIVEAARKRYAGHMRDLLVKAGLGLVTAAYVRDAVTKPYEMAGIARKLARGTGKPLVNIGAGVSGHSLRAAVLGERLWGDVNLDDCAPLCAPGPNVVSYCDYYTLPWSDRYFGCLFACDVMENLEHPDRALAEWQRVADYVVVVVPALWRPDKLMSRWYVESDLTKAWPIWSRRSRIAFLPVSDNRAYAPGRCPTPPPVISRPPSPRASPSEPRDPSPPLSPKAPTPQPQPPQLTVDGSESSNAVSTLAVLSGFNPEST